MAYRTHKSSLYPYAIDQPDNSRCHIHNDSYQIRPESFRAICGTRAMIIFLQDTICISCRSYILLMLIVIRRCHIFHSLVKSWRLWLCCLCTRLPKLWFWIMSRIITELTFAQCWRRHIYMKVRIEQAKLPYIKGRTSFMKRPSGWMLEKQFVFKIGYTEWSSSYVIDEKQFVFNKADTYDTLHDLLLTCFDASR